MSQFYDKASLVVVPSGYKAGTVYAQKPLDGSGDLTFTRTGDTATRVNSAGLIVPVLANVPRLDYLGSTCPRLLLEPQRTNLTQYSEQLNNAYWNKSGGTITANSTASPDGYVNADLFTESATTGDHAIFDIVNYFVAGTTYTASFFVKANGRTKIQLNSANSDTCPRGQFDLVALTATPVGASFNAKIESYGNGWYRCSVSRVAPNTGQDLPYYAMNTTFASNSYAGNGTSGMYFWGMQMEAGAYATSYIPTLAASATRGADACSKTGISSLIGQTEGTIYWEGNGSATSGGVDLWLANISVDDTSVAVLLYYVASTGTVQAFINNGTSNVILDAAMTLTQVNKVAVAYKNASFALYLNGALVDSSSSAIAPPTGMNQFSFVKWTGQTNQQRALVSQALLFKTRLTNAELAELTTL